MDARCTKHAIALARTLALVVVRIAIDAASVVDRAPAVAGGLVAAAVQRHQECVRVWQQGQLEGTHPAG